MFKEGIRMALIGATLIGIGGWMLPTTAEAISRCVVLRNTEKNGWVTCQSRAGAGSQVRVKLDCFDNFHASHITIRGPWKGSKVRSKATCSVGTTNYPGGVGYEIR